MSPCDWNLFLACDMPLVRTSLLQDIADRVSAGHGPAIVPNAGGRWQPLCAAYHRSCLPTMEQAIAHGRFSIVHLLPFLPVDSISIADGDLEMFHNVNTVDDWQRLQKIAGDK
jgi:molybdopterin-guanine dinucleotide biosynthesis protein A